MEACLVGVVCESTVTICTLCKSLRFPRPLEIEVSFDLHRVNLGESLHMCP